MVVKNKIEISGENIPFNLTGITAIFPDFRGEIYIHCERISWAC